MSIYSLDSLVWSVKIIECFCNFRMLPFAIDFMSCVKSIQRNLIVGMYSYIIFEPTSQDKKG